MEAVAFDFYETLVYTKTIRKSVVGRCLEELRSRGHRFSDNEFWDAYNKAYHMYDTGKTSRSGMAARTLEYLGLGTDMKAIDLIDRTTQEWESPQNHYVGDGVVETLEDLDGEYKLGVISNGVKDVEMRIFKTFGLERFFPEEMVTTSSDVGVRKPDRYIFESGINRMGMVPKDVAYVGDEVCHDAPAAALGISTIILNANSDDDNLSLPLRFLEIDRMDFPYLTVSDFRRIPKVVRSLSP